MSTPASSATTSTTQAAAATVSSAAAPTEGKKKSKAEMAFERLKGLDMLAAAPSGDRKFTGYMEDPKKPAAAPAEPTSPPPVDPNEERLEEMFALVAPIKAAVAAHQNAKTKKD